MLSNQDAKGPIISIQSLVRYILLNILTQKFIAHMIVFYYVVGFMSKKRLFLVYHVYE